MCHLAAGGVPDPLLSAMLTLLGHDRRQHARELQGYVRLNDCAPRDGMTKSGVLRAIWADLRIVFTGRDPLTILLEAQQGEVRLFDLYEEVLRGTSGSPVNHVLLRQARKVKAACERMRAAIDALTPVEV
jgi:uncharacterized protein (TIGR02284 family)